MAAAKRTTTTTTASSSTPTVPADESLDRFVSLFRQRLYRQLVLEGERLLAKVECGGAAQAADVLLKSAQLLATAEAVRS